MRGDSVGKIVTRYFACLAREPFAYGKTEFTPKPLVVSPMLLRDYTCPANCGACCLAWSLDYLPSESPRPDNLAPRTVPFNGGVEVLSDLQDGVEGYCRHLSREDGRCGAYAMRPFSCDFELIRTLESKGEESPNTLTQKLYGRGWNMPRVDGERGARCEMTEPSPHSVREVIRKLRRLQDWADHFGLRTWAPEIIGIVETNRLTRKVVLSDRRLPLA